MSKRPWIWIVVLLAIFVTANVSVFVAAQLSHGPDLMPSVEESRP